MRDIVALKIIHQALSEGRNFLYEYESKELLSLLGMQTMKSLLAKSLEETELAAKNIGFPVVLKIVSPEILHKSDAGGVLIDLKNAQEVKSGYFKIINNVKSKVPQANVMGILVQEMAPPSIEIIAGATRDPQFGPTIMFGIGGILVELIKDVSFGIAPLNKTLAEEMIHKIKSHGILEGTRGLPKADTNEIVNILLKLSEVMTDYPEIDTLDLNPIIVYSKGLKIVDARFILGKGERVESEIQPKALELGALLEPKSVAIIGASKNFDKIGYKILKNIVDAGFNGGIYPINPTAGEILGLKTYASVLDVPEKIDVGVIVVPAQVVPSVIEECVKKEIKGVIIISSGFRDIGQEGAKLEKGILEIAKKGKLRIIGPNCQGVSNPKVGFCATWPLIKKVGNIAVISQSGSIALEIPSFLSKNELGYSKAIALGNKSDVNEAELISFLADDEGTRVITVYSEGIPDGRKLMNAIEKASQKKAVLFLKGGKTEAGKRGVMAHTGSLAGEMKVFEAAIDQSGGICVKNLDELCNAAIAFVTLPVPKGNRLLIITSSGGSGILGSDACEEADLVLSNLSMNTLEKLKKSLPSWCIIRNPVDLTGNVLNNVQLYNDALEIVLDDESVDMVMLIFGDPIPNALETVKHGIDKAFSLGIPVVVNYLGGAEVQIVETEKLQKNGIPVFSTPNQAIIALSYMNKYRENLLKLKNINMN